MFLARKGPRSIEERLTVATGARLARERANAREISAQISDSKFQMADGGMGRQELGFGIQDLGAGERKQVAVHRWGAGTTEVCDPGGVE